MGRIYFEGEWKERRDKGIGREGGIVGMIDKNIERGEWKGKGRREKERERRRREEERKTNLRQSFNNLV